MTARTDNCQSLYTAARIGAALGKSCADRSRQGVHARLKDVPASGFVQARGGQAKAWAFDALPDDMQDELKVRARRLGYRDADHLLSTPPRQWQPPIPLNEIASQCLEKADKLRQALAAVFARMEDSGTSESELAALGVRELARIFGYSISERHWRTLFKRTLDRDGGAENFDRLEIYLDDRLARKRRAPIPAAALRECQELEALLASFKDPQNPTSGEQAMLWQYAFEHFERTATAATKRMICEFLHARAPFLSGTFDGVRKQFDRKLARWIEGGRLPALVEDQRHKKSGWHRAPTISQEDRDKLVGHSVLFTGGRVTQAWRELLRSEGLSEELAGYYLSNPSNKSYVPKHVRDEVKWDVALLNDVHHGPRQAQLNGAYLSRDWSCVAAGDWYQADDCTCPIVYYEPDGKDGVRLLRGQLLLMIDLRSTCILGYALLSNRNYNSLAIRTLITRTGDEHGLPRKGFYFERGIWYSSRILKGDRRANAVSWPEAEKGLGDLGLRFIHARLPRSKPVERVLGAMQDLMERMPGYVGRDERRDRFERVQELKRQVESRKLEPEGHFLSADDWLAKLDEICDRYNSEQQNGKMTEGLSPADAFEKFQNRRDPQIRFDASCRYLLAHHRRPIRVTRNGITLRFGKNVFNYRNEITGRLIGQTVIAWFNPEIPDLLCVSDMKREHVFAVDRTQEVPAVDAPKELLGREFSSIAAHQSHARTYYRILRRKFPATFRPNLVDAATADLGREMQEQLAERDAAVKRERRQMASARKLAGELNMPLHESLSRRPEALEAAANLAKTLSEEDGDE